MVFDKFNIYPNQKNYNVATVASGEFRFITTNDIPTFSFLKSSNVRSPFNFLKAYAILFAWLVMLI
jgi:hypothetical protein